jgi:hypothetical protein
MPDIHPLVDKLYTPYDIGQIGQLDLHILTELFGGEQAARDLTPAWNGGLYWAGQQRSAKTATDHPTDKDPSAGTPADQAGTSSIALFYLSAWKSAASAQAFAQLYARELARKYSGVKSSRPVRYAVFPPSASPSMNTDDSASDPDASDPTTLPGEKLFSTSEGTVLITTRGNLVFVAESFDLDLARKLTALVLDAQATGEIHAAKTIAATHDSATGEPLTANLIRFFSNCGVMKSAVSAAMQAAR